MRCRFQYCPVPAKRRDRRFSLDDKRLEPLARTIDPQQAQERRLVGGRIFSRRLANSGCVAFDIEQVIGDLKGFADRRTVTFERRTRLAGRLAEHGSTRAGKLQEGSGLHCLQSFYVAEIKFAPPAICKSTFGRKIEHLPASHSAETGGSRKRGNELNSDLGLCVCLRAREGIEGEGQKGIARQDSGWFVEGLL